MKNSLFGLFLFPALFSFGQQLKWADSLELSKQDDFLYVNANMEQKVTIEESTTLLIDFSLRDATLPIDSASVLYNGKRITSERLMPLLILGADESFAFQIELYKDGKVLSFSNGEERASFEVNRLDKPVFVNDEIVLGVLLVVLAFIFYTSHKKSKFWTKFYTIVPALLLCYLVPAILDMLGLISKEYSELYPMARDYLLPAALILMTIGIDFKGIINLGPKALIMFFTATSWSYNRWANCNSRLFNDRSNSSWGRRV
jgi:hypothetical protein